VYDGRRALRAIRFFERVLKHPKENYAPFILLPWQRFILASIFGRLNESGDRAIRRAYLEMAKKNGKSEFAAGIALYMLAADGESAAEVYGAATTKDQAGKVFEVAAAMVRASPFLNKHYQVISHTKTIVKRSDPLSFYRAISADGFTQDGMNPHCVIIDELHRWTTTRALELYQVLMRSKVARRQPLAFEITTAGSTREESPLAYNAHEHVINIQKGVYEDKRFLGVIFAADESDDWTLPSTWEKANPSLETKGGFLKLAALQEMCDAAQNQPATLSDFRRYHLGIWLSSEKEWMPAETWDRGNVPLRAIVGRSCYLGGDLSATTDLTSLVLLFPDPADDSFDVLPFFWMARDRVRERTLADRVPYDHWVDQGLIETTEGDVIDQKAILAKIKWATEIFSVKELAFDPAHANQFAIEADDQFGITCVPVPARYTHLSLPTKHLMELALQGKLRHNGHPVLRWNALCTRVRSNDNDEQMPAKPKRLTDSKRIDGIVALILALSRGMFENGSVYDTRGIVTT